MESVKSSNQRVVCLNHSLLVRALKLVAGGVDKKNSHPTTLVSNVLVQVTRNLICLTTTDQELEVCAQISWDGGDDSVYPVNFAVEYKKFTDVWRALGSMLRLQMVVDDTRLIVRSGRTRYSLALGPNDNFPRMTNHVKVCDMELPVADLRYALEKTIFAIADQDVRYYFNGMLFEIMGAKLNLVASDGHRIALANIKGITHSSAQEIRVIIPRKTVVELMRLISPELSEGTDFINVEFGHSSFRASIGETVLISKLIDSRFPPYQKVFPKTISKNLLLDSKLLKSSLHQVATLLDDRSMGVEFALKPNLLSITAINNLKETAQTEIEIDYNGDSMEIAFSAKYLLDFLSICDSPQIELGLNDKDSGVLIKPSSSDGYLCVLMPMQL